MTRRNAIRASVALLLVGAMIGLIWIGLERWRFDAEDADFVVRVPATGPIAYRSLKHRFSGESFERMPELARELGGLSSEHKVVVFIDPKATDSRSPERIGAILGPATSARLMLLIEPPERW